MKSLVKGLSGLLAGAALCALAVPASAQGAPTAPAGAKDDLDKTAERFGIRASVLDISLSPSGRKLAWIAPGPNHTEVLRVYDLDSDAGIQTIAGNSEIIADLARCEWATEVRMVCQVQGMAKTGDGLLLPFTRMFAIDEDGSEVDQLTERQDWSAIGFNQDGGNIVALDVAGEPGQILMTREWIKEVEINTRLANDKEGLGVDRIDVESGKRKVEEQPDDGAVSYLADENGAVRFKTRGLFDGRGYDTGERVHMVRRKGESSWETLEGVTLGGAAVPGFSPVAVDGERDVLFAYVSINGYRALIEIPLSGAPQAKILAARDDVDVDGLIRIGRQRRVVGVSYATEKRDVEYFDEELAEFAAALAKALPNQPLIDIAGASADESRLLVIASSDTDPGTIYLYDKASRQLEELLALREFLVGVQMGQMQPVTFPAADGTEIPGYLTLPAGSDGKGLPAIVLPHGGPAARDYWGFDWLVQFFTARGYGVLQPNYRGSAGYGEAWFGRNGYQAWDVAIGDVNDAGRWLVEQGIADPERLAIVGWSYGGYAALQSQVVDPDLFRAVVAIAPVTDLEFLRDEARRYTGFRARDEQLGNGPHIAAGSPQRHADRFKAPVALFHGTLDGNVSVRHSRAMADALRDLGKPVSYTEFEDLEHSIDDSRARADMLTEIDRFLSGAFAG
ncbi:alpha/beta hydrolase family protein [Erythrobacter sp.]|jgi:dipeptidyl aminopeptidase/acylaminoacyl peptidase|uniref:alpha/beta hydrolase family protein n=1 Tax=Erythrobacter sp. TaxID=1042 RepID=UPI002EB82F47|nr:S9 family peptidase [Erythrobacter sp.]